MERQRDESEQRRAEGIVSATMLMEGTTLPSGGQAQALAMAGEPRNSTSKLSWVNDIEIDDLLTGDMRLIQEWCGREILLSLLENFASMTLYISAKPLTEAKKRYIKKYYNGKNTKELCLVLDVSERFVYEVMSGLVKNKVRR